MGLCLGIPVYERQNLLSVTICHSVVALFAIFCTKPKPKQHFIKRHYFLMTIWATNDIYTNCKYLLKDKTIPDSTCVIAVSKYQSIDNIKKLYRWVVERFC